MELAESDAASLNLLLKVGKYIKMATLARKACTIVSTGLGFLKGHGGAGVPHRVFSSKRDRSARLELLARLMHCYVFSASQCYC